MDIFDAFKINLLSIDDETRNKNSVAHSHLFSFGHFNSLHPNEIVFLFVK